MTGMTRDSEETQGAHLRCISTAHFCSEICDSLQLLIGFGRIQVDPLGLHPGLRQISDLLQAAPPALLQGQVPAQGTQCICALP